MRCRISIYLLLLLLPGVLFAQKEYNIWYFGHGGGVDFNGPTPVALGNGKMGLMPQPLEGCASICDRSNGTLLFYTDGVSIWNRYHRTMPNGTGLKGHISSTQSALIVPMPGDSLAYYIFTALQ